MNNQHTKIPHMEIQHENTTQKIQHKKIQHTCTKRNLILFARNFNDGESTKAKIC